MKRLILFTLTVLIIGSSAPIQALDIEGFLRDAVEKYIEKEKFNKNTR